MTLNRFINTSISIMLVLVSFTVSSVEKEVGGTFNKETVVVHGEIESSLIDAGVKLINEVLKKDTKSLGVYFGNLSSYAHKELYDSSYNEQFGSKAVYDILKEFRSLNIKVRNSGKGIKVLFFYDPSIINIEFPYTKNTGKHWKLKFVTCRFEKKGNNWVPYKTLFEGG